MAVLFFSLKNIVYWWENTRHVKHLIWLSQFQLLLKRVNVFQSIHVKLGLAHCWGWMLLGSTESKLSVRAMGCGDTSDCLAARSPIRTQLSVSRRWRTPAIKAPARLQSGTVWMWERVRTDIGQMKSVRETVQGKGSRRSRSLAPISCSWHICCLLWQHSQCWVVQSTKPPHLKHK